MKLYWLATPASYSATNGAATKMARSASHSFVELELERLEAIQIEALEGPLYAHFQLPKAVGMRNVIGKVCSPILMGR